MIAPSLSSRTGPRRLRAARRWAFGLTPRSDWLLLAVGFVWLIPGFWDRRLAYAMLAWDCAGAAVCAA